MDKNESSVGTVRCVSPLCVCPFDLAALSCVIDNNSIAFVWVIRKWHGTTTTTNESINQS